MKDAPPPPHMLEALLVTLDVGPCGAALRIALGAALVAFVHGLPGGGGFARAALALAALLFFVKVFAAIARRIVPATSSVRHHWEWRRELARYNDSYQWRKMIWVGAGIVAGGAALPRAGWEWPLGGACLAAGLLGEVVWRRKELAIEPPRAGLTG